MLSWLLIRVKRSRDFQNVWSMTRDYNNVPTSFKDVERIFRKASEWRFNRGETREVVGGGFGMVNLISDEKVWSAEDENKESSSTW